MTAAGYRDNQGRAIHDGGKNHRTEVRRIHRVNRQKACLRISGHTRIQRLIVGGSDYQVHAMQIVRLVAAQNAFTATLLHHLAQLSLDFGRHDTQHRARLRQQARLAQGYLAAADDQHPAPLKVVKQRQVFHIS